MKDAEQARQFINGLARTMERRARPRNHEHWSDDGASAMKNKYGDTWKYLYGVHSGMQKIHAGRLTEWDEDARDVVVVGVSDAEWQDHYDEFGYGPYGEGLKLGKRLALYDDETEFEFVEPDDSDESEFTFIT